MRAAMKATVAHTKWRSHDEHGRLRSSATRPATVIWLGVNGSEPEAAHEGHAEVAAAVRVARS